MPEIPPLKWTTEVLRVRNLVVPGEAHGYGEIDPPVSLDHTLGVMPAPEATEQTVIRHIRQLTAAVKKALDTKGVLLPTGSALLWDRQSDTLAVRTTEDTMETLRGLATYSIDQPPMQIEFTLHVIQGEAGAMRELERESAGQYTQTPTWKKAESLINQNHATRLGTLSITSKSGQTSRASSGSESTTLESFALEETGPRLRHVARVQGTELEITGVISPNAREIDFSYTLRQDLAPAVSRSLPVPGLLLTDVCSASVSAVGTMPGDSFFLLGLWKPGSATAELPEDVLQAAFLQARLTQSWREANPRVLALLNRYADKAEPIPLKPEVPKPLPAGMESRKYRLPPDYFMTFQTDLINSAPADPFAPQASPNKILEPADILKAEGVPFPDGAKAYFDPGSGTLTVVNTPENHLLIENLANELIGKGPPQTLQMTLEIVEAEGGLIRAMEAETSKSGTHDRAMENLLAKIPSGRVRQVSILRMPTRSGQRASAQAGTSVAVVAFPPDKAPPAGSDPEASTPNKSPSPAATSGAPSSREKGTIEHRNVGTRLEIDPVIGPDGDTLDLTLEFEHHFAPPDLAGVGTPAPAATAADSPISAGTPTFHRAIFQSAFTMPRDSARLVGIWKPSGSPNYDGKDILQAAFLRVSVVHTPR